MRRRVAERLAATALSDLGVGQVREVIATYLAELGRCPACDGTGTVTYAQEIVLSIVDQYEHPIKIPAGSVERCPRCGDRDGGDPEFVAWHCTRYDSLYTCQHYSDNNGGGRGVHAACGYRLMIPLDDVRQRKWATAEAGQEHP